MKRTAWRVVISGVAVSFALGSSEHTALVSLAASSSDSLSPVAVPKPELRKWLFQVGADPETLTAAGASPTSAAAAVSNARSFLAENLLTLNDLQKAASAAVSQVSKVSPENQAYEQLKATADSAVAARDSAIARLKDAVFEGLGSEAPALAAAIVRNRQFGLPIQYLVKDRTDAEWTTLREALATAKAASDRGETVASHAEGIIATADSDVLVATAAARLQSGLALVRTAWKEAIESE